MFTSEDMVANYDNVFELQYLDMVLSEAMRVYPPIPSIIGRSVTFSFKVSQTPCPHVRWAAEERTICGKVIPRHCAVAAAVWVLHHDPRFWTDPWTFDPERFAPENRSEQKLNNPLLMTIF